jgi:hypothetical protein
MSSTFFWFFWWSGIIVWSVVAIAALALIALGIWVGILAAIFTKRVNRLTAKYGRELSFVAQVQFWFWAWWNTPDSVSVSGFDNEEGKVYWPGIQRIEGDDE